jgi:hypothetical protein
MDRALTYEQVVSRLAPCGIDCERCAMAAQGRVRKLATELGDALTGFDKMAARLADKDPALAGYEGFLDVLRFFTEASCAGCREGGPPLPFCAARTCAPGRGVDFCFQCVEYPCERNSYPENLAERWRAVNDRMRDVGVEQAYSESLKTPRY